MLVAFLPFVQLHNPSYKRDLGKVVVLTALHGVLSAWYFGGDHGLFWEFTKLIYLARFVNVDS